MRATVGRLAVGSLIAGGAVAAMIGVGSGQAAAAPTNCVSVHGVPAEQVSGMSGCGATSDKSSRSAARDTNGTGTAVAASRTGGNATAVNNSYKGAALSGAQSRGIGQSFTYGPAGTAVTQARFGGTSVAVAGWGGSAYSGVGGVQCSGGPAVAWDSITGKVCLSTGGINLHS